jgi:hypothetical protein
MNNFCRQVIWLSGMPRSGTTWLSQIFASSPQVRLKFCPLFSNEFKNLLDETSSAEEWENLFFNVYHRNSEFLDQDYLRKKGFIPTFPLKDGVPSHLVIKTTRFHNLVPKLMELNKTIRFVHLVRDPRATIHSWLTNPHEFPDDANPQVEWRSGFCRNNGPGEFWGFDAWKAVNLQALNLQKDYANRFRIWSYEDLSTNLTSIVDDMFSFCDLIMQDQTSEFLVESQRKHSSSKRSVYKTPHNLKSWKGNLDASIADTCAHELIETPLSIFLRD